ncbi:MAG: ASKHA domain-containing protein [Alphaproteobacteria bacterium]
MPSGRRGRFPIGTTVLEAARSLGVDIDSVCGGNGICGRCQIVVSEGEFSKFGLESRVDHLSGYGANEVAYRERQTMKPGRRLSCSSTIRGDLVIDVPPESQVHKQVVRKRAEVRAIEIDPVVTLHYVKVEEPDMHKPSGDFERLKQALADQWQLEGLTARLAVIQGLQAALRQGDWKVTVAVRERSEIIHVWPEFHDAAFGIAYDVGSTTIAAHLTDLHSGEVVASVGRMNPQIRFGEDLMSRVSYIMMNPGGDVRQTEAVREAVNELAGEAAERAQINREDILEVVVVGNPIMHHLYFGINPIELGGAPFALATNGQVDVRASELGLDINPGGYVHSLPCIAGHVGADAAGVVLSEEPNRRDELTLVVDVGTNAEIVLGNKERLLACSSPTGPALEGAQILHGQRAAPGAIDRVRIDPVTLEPTFTVIGCNLWSDHEHFVSATRRSGITGICGSGIIEVIGEMFLAGILTADGVLDPAMAEKNDRVVPNGRTADYILWRGDESGEGQVRVTQNDVRAIQLAKGALYAGARLLMDKLDVASPERVVLAGAFGSHIDPKYAMLLGLIPDCPLDKVSAAGNAAGTGARIALLNRKSREDIADVVRRIEKIETAVEPMFQQHFVEAMAIPHKTAASTYLSQVVTLPAPKEVNLGGEGGGEGGRRRRRGRGAAA